MVEMRLAPLGGDRFRVEVIEAEGSTTHEVEVSSETLERLGWEGSLEELIRRSFGFLLEREPKEAILAEFELSEIARYFPEWEGEMTGG